MSWEFLVLVILLALLLGAWVVMSEYLDYCREQTEKWRREQEGDQHGD